MKSLLLNDMKFNETMMDILNKFLSKNQKLEELGLGNCNINDDSLQILKPGLCTNVTLKVK